MVAQNLDFGAFAYGAEMFAARDDTVVLSDIFVQTARRIVGALLGLNRIYLLTPKYKAMDELISQMRLAPPDLAPRLKLAFRLPAPAAVRLLRALIEETLTLIETHLPTLDTAPARALNHPRGAWDHAPGVLMAWSRAPDDAAR